MARAGRVPARKGEVDDVMRHRLASRWMVGARPCGRAGAGSWPPPGCGGDDASRWRPPTTRSWWIRRRRRSSVPPPHRRTASATATSPVPRSSRSCACRLSRHGRRSVPAGFIQCHVEAFSTSSKQRPESVYIESEDWRVAVGGRDGGGAGDLRRIPDRRLPAQGPPARMQCAARPPQSAARAAFTERRILPRWPRPDAAPTAP